MREIVNFSCGHSVEVNLPENKKKREDKILELETSGLCPACRQADQEKQDKEHSKKCVCVRMNKEKYENLKKEKTMKESAISLEKTSIRTRNGKITDGFIITDKPLFCKVAEMMGEITTINYQHKQIVFNEIDSNKRNINLFEYLIKRISTIKYYKTDDKAKKTKKGKEYSNRIAYSKFFEEVFLREEQTLKTEGSIERTKRKIKPIINIMLNLLKKENYIKDFEYYKTINNKTYRYSQGIEMMF